MCPQQIMISGPHCTLQLGGFFSHMQIQDLHLVFTHFYCLLLDLKRNNCSEGNLAMTQFLLEQVLTKTRNQRQQQETKDKMK